MSEVRVLKSLRFANRLTSLTNKSIVERTNYWISSQTWNVKREPRTQQQNKISQRQTDPGTPIRQACTT